MGFDGSQGDRGDKQVAYADDLTGGGKIEALKFWFDAIVAKGPAFGYNAEPCKSWLIFKEDKLEQAKLVFADTQVNVTSSGQKHLGAVIGNSDYKTEFANKLVDEWVKQIKHIQGCILCTYSPLPQGGGE